jgi:hypothetical protein
MIGGVSENLIEAVTAKSGILGVHNRYVSTAQET